MRKIQNSIFLIFVCLFSAQSQENDFQSWHLFSINKEINNKTDVRLKTGLRFRENSSINYKQFYDLKFKKVFNKRVSLSSGYRYSINCNKKFVSSNNHRLYLDVNYKNKIIKRLSYALRSRFQNQIEMNSYRFILRQKFSLAYNIRKTKLTPKVASEYFLKFEDGITKIRSSMSLSYPIYKNLDFDLAYRIQQEFYVSNPETLFIFEGKFSYNL